ncbi:MAG: ribosome maturation factor RimM [Candidatus Symbiothrix sp.]|jgi:16S rRNA processing protein RimM|nr:ribosome maturation factor RimM [Candidatus Symbiothrix sp.]
MIQPEELIKIGQFKKPHGIKGEIRFFCTNNSFEDCKRPFLICELDGIFVPFLLEKYRSPSDSSVLVKLKNIDSGQKATLLANKDVYFPKSDFREETPGEIFTWDYFTGFTLADKHRGEIGLISDVDTSTVNTLFVIEKEDGEILIPAANEWIISIDKQGKKLVLELPEGLTE